MANDIHEPTTAHTDHNETYEGFTSATKWGVILVAMILVLMAIFLV